MIIELLVLSQYFKREIKLTKILKTEDKKKIKQTTTDADNDLKK